MSATTHSPTVPGPDATSARARSTRAGRVIDIALAFVAHIAVGVSWVLVAASVMGSLDVARRMVMNSEFAWDTGRLPQPWVIPLALIAAWLSQRFFLWSMRRVGGGRLLWGSRVVALSGALLGVLVGAYLWTPALQVGAQIGPLTGESRPWGVLGWAAHHSARIVPAVMGLVTLVFLVASKHSPVVVIVRGFIGWWRRTKPVAALRARLRRSSSSSLPGRQG